MFYYLLYLVGMYEYDKKEMVIESIAEKIEETEPEKKVEQIKYKNDLINKYLLVIEELKEKIRDRIILD